MKPDAVYSVVFPIKEDAQGRITHIVLGIKARKIFAGLLVGPGGRMDLADETIRQCGCRETKEEVNRRYVEDELIEVGVIVSHEPTCISEVHFFLARGGVGRVCQTRRKEILDPTWYEPLKIPHEKLPRHYPLLIWNFIHGYRVDGQIRIDPRKNELLGSDLKISKI